MKKCPRKPAVAIKSVFLDWSSWLLKLSRRNTYRGGGAKARGKIGSVRSY